MNVDLKTHDTYYDYLLGQLKGFTSLSFNFENKIVDEERISSASSILAQLTQFQCLKVNLNRNKIDYSGAFLITLGLSQLQIFYLSIWA